MKIGYQGIRYSNTYFAARDFARRNKLELVEFFPLISAREVVLALKDGYIDYGVMALKNSIAGEVTETAIELKKEKEIQLQDTFTETMRHALFNKDKSSKIKKIVSHPQVLQQCLQYIKEHYKNAEVEEMADTALAAKLLAGETMPCDIAVICRKEAGYTYNLNLVRENIEKDTSETTYGLFTYKNM